VRSIYTKKNQKNTSNFTNYTKYLKKIFIVTPCFNDFQTIDQSIQSVIRQAGNFVIHYHVQDGGSSDGTIGKLAQWEKLLSKPNSILRCPKVKFTWSISPDKGVYDAILKGFDTLMVGPDDFMTWINCGDTLLPKAVGTILRIQSEYPEVHWIGSHTHNIDQEGKTPCRRPNPTPTAVIREGLCDGHCNFWYHLQLSGSFFKKHLWFRSKHALRGFRFAGDWSLWREMANHAEYYHWVLFVDEMASCQWLIAINTTVKLKRFYQ
jgi:glycosyltransferase involved in cell wall biosynthesis